MGARHHSAMAWREARALAAELGARLAPAPQGSGAEPGPDAGAESARRGGADAAEARPDAGAASAEPTGAGAAEAPPGAGVRVCHVPLEDAAGATLAAPLVARVALPSADTAAMDGYAVSGPGPWTVVARRLAGQPGRVPRLASGEAVEIATGAAVPDGAAAVLAYEAAGRDGDTVYGEVAPGRHVRRAAEDVAVGQRVLPEGAVVTPPVLGLAASLGLDRLPVLRPEVLVLVTGDELVSAGVPAPGQARDALGPLLPGLIAWAGGRVAAVHHLGDTAAALRERLRRARADRVPLVAVCGASSAGPADHLRPVLDELGGTAEVDGVACRPGHPQVLARLGTPEEPAPLVVGLPGNPFAALVAALTLLVPALSAMAGRADPALHGPRRTAVLAGHPAPRDTGDTRLRAVRVHGGRAEATGGDRPASLQGAALADALAVLPPGWQDGEVNLLWLPR